MTLAVLTSQLPSDPRAQILAQARVAFVEKGFDGASMQDLARAAGMSAGNFYRYFPSKAAIVEALVARELALIHADFAEIEVAADPMAAIRTTIMTRIATGCDPDRSLWAEIMAAGQRRPEIALTLQQLETAVVGHMTRLFALLRNMPQDEAARRYDTHARFIMLLVRGAELDLTINAPGNAPGNTPGNAAPQSPLIDMVIAHVGHIIDAIVKDDLPS